MPAAPAAAEGAVLGGLQPQPLFNFFEQLSAVPRPSFKEERVLNWLKEFAETHGLKWKEDAARNLVISRPGSGGGENAPTVALQSHVDMVTEKNETTDFDFLTQGIRLVVDGDWVKADGTTLGADDGIGVATALALLAAGPAAKLPPLEALFTVVEEQGMDGAFGLGEDMLTAKYLVNLDTEEWGYIYVGSAGAGATVVTLAVDSEPAPSGLQPYELKVRGLAGGHSGADIEKGFGNSVVMMGQALEDVLEAVPGVKLVTMNAGFKRNAIPREGTALLMVPPEAAAKLQESLAATQKYLNRSHGRTEPNLNITAEPAGADFAAASVMTDDCARRLASLLTTLPNGVERMSDAVPGLVETSSNLGYCRPAPGANGEASPANAAPAAFVIESYCRTMLDMWHLDKLRAKQRRVAELLGGQVETGRAYPGWAPDPNARLVKLTRDLMKAVLGSEPKVEAIHAGLECGLISVKYPAMEIVSFGPTILGAHTPEERLQISTVAPYWEVTLKVLEAIADEKA